MNRQLLGGFSPARFMRDYWQKQPLLVRGAFPDFQQPCSAREVLALARDDTAESRLITRGQGKWSLEHGPFAAAQLKRLGKRDWTILVQDTQHFLPGAHAVLGAFNFIPHARVDDLMVSLAAPGGGVGPHFDSYDVFLVQGSGRRRWRISAQQDLSLKPGVPLKILQRFKPEQEWVLECGDMLYLPPGYAHDGVAEDECLTWSVGFRAPSYQELLGAFLDHLRDTLEVPGQYNDPELKPVLHPGEIPSTMLATLKRKLSDIHWDAVQAQEFVGRFLSEPKSHVFFDAPVQPLTLTRFAQLCRTAGLTLDLRTRCIYRGMRIFANGEGFDLGGVAAADAARLRSLADHRSLAPCALGTGAMALLHKWYRAGYVHPATTPAPDD